MAEAQRHAARLRALAHALHERRDDRRPRAPGDVEARHRVAVLGRQIAAALGPADDREPAHAPRVQPGRASRRRRRRRRPPPTCAASDPPSRSKPAVPIQSCSARSWLSRMRMRRCSGESTNISPPNDQNACPPSDCSPSWSSRITRLPGVDQLAGRDQPGQPAADDDHIRVHAFLSRPLPAGVCGLSSRRSRPARAASRGRARASRPPPALTSRDDALASRGVAHAVPSRPVPGSRPADSRSRSAGRALRSSHMEERASRIDRQHAAAPRRRNSQSGQPQDARDHAAARTPSMPRRLDAGGLQHARAPPRSARASMQAPAPVRKLRRQRQAATAH